MATYNIADLPTRFQRKIEICPPSDCWIWTGARTKGYGCLRMKDKQKTIYAHREVFRLLTGKLNDSKEMDHLCKTKACVNPAHVEEVTHRENMRRHDWHLKTHCVHGHKYEEVGFYFSEGKRGRGHCRACKANERQRYRAKKTT